MAKAGFWKNVFGQKEEPKAKKVPVDIGSSTEMLTSTQKYRFEELSDRVPVFPSRYSLDEAARRLKITECQVLERAANGDLSLFVDMTGTAGNWQRRDADGSICRSAETMIGSGLLKLRMESCKDLLRNGSAVVCVLDFCEVTDAASAGLDAESQLQLASWGNSRKHFSPLQPLTVERDMLVLVPPL